jgi:hypothetical protein
LIGVGATAEVSCEVAVVVCFWGDIVVVVSGS